MKRILLILLFSFASRAHAQVQPAQTNDEMQPSTLPVLPYGMSIQQIVHGDSLFHGRGGCFACHGAEAQGLPAAGDGFTTGLNYVQAKWQDIAQLIARGLPDALTRAPIRMPARGARGDLTNDELRAVAAYVWAISQTHGEPWPGGHTGHEGMLPPGATKGTAGLRIGDKR
jgi:mono/diheme cytochrome c family protein